MTLNSGCDSPDYGCHFHDFVGDSHISPDNEDNSLDFVGHSVASGDISHDSPGSGNFRHLQFYFLVCFLYLEAFD